MYERAPLLPFFPVCSLEKKTNKQTVHFHINSSSRNRPRAIISTCIQYWRTVNVERKKTHHEIRIECLSFSHPPHTFIDNDFDSGAASSFSFVARVECNVSCWVGFATVVLFIIHGTLLFSIDSTWKKNNKGAQRSYMQRAIKYDSVQHHSRRLTPFCHLLSLLSHTPGWYELHEMPWIN